MLDKLPSIPYPPSKEGYWGTVTSTLNWCEEDYYATPYSAEIVNSFTNLMFMFLAFKGIANCIRYKHDKVFLVAYAGYLVVGSGSFFFHSTLKYPMQLVDELSMIYTTSIMLYASFAHGRSLLYSAVLSAALASLSLSITAYYHYVEDPVFHQFAYGLLTAALLFRSVYVMETGVRPARRTPAAERAVLASVAATVEAAQKQQNGHAEGAADGDTANGGEELALPAEGLSLAQIAELRRRDERDLAILRTMWAMIAYGLSVFLGGFAIWALDIKYCSLLRQWRHEVGLPWGILLEGHGWWHLMTGVGAYFYIVWGIWLRYCLEGRQDDVEFIWPRLVTSFPEVKIKSSRSSSVKLNGESKKQR